MADTLLEALRTSLSAPAGPAPTPAPLGQTASIQKLASAKSGKAQPMAASAPATSSLAEQVAERTSAAGMSQLQQAGATEAAGLQQAEQGQQQEADIQGKQLDSKQLDMSEQLSRQAAAILADYYNNKSTLDLNKQKARAENLGFNLRLSNDKYIHQLADQGRRSRLMNASAFQEALSRTIFDDELGLFQSDMQFRSMLRADDRQFQEQLGGIDLDFALSMAAQDTKQANQTMMWQGIGGVGQAGVAGYGAYKKGEFDSKDRKDGEEV